jgi:choline monooxygenase
VLWARERETVFARAWMFACHVSAVAAPGDWRAETLAGYPVLIVRDEAGVLRAFHNVCRHRAGPLSGDEAQGCGARDLVCRYHGWRYALDGRLKLARDFGRANDFDPRDYALLPLQVTQWRGLVFVSLDANAAPLAALLAPLDARLGAADWSGHHVAATRTHALACNWKTYVENYLEGYHLSDVHPALAAEMDATRYAVRVEGGVAIHDAPPLKPDAVYDGLWAWIWPNVALNIYRRGLMVERMAPVSLGATRLDYAYLMAPGESVSEETMALSDAVAAEDKWIVERVQQNLDAGAYDAGRLSPRHEGAVAAFQEMVRAAVR